MASVKDRAWRLIVHLPWEREGCTLKDRAPEDVFEMASRILRDDFGLDVSGWMLLRMARSRAIMERAGRVNLKGITEWDAADALALADARMMEREQGPFWMTERKVVEAASRPRRPPRIPFKPRAKRNPVDMPRNS